MLPAVSPPSPTGHLMILDAAGRCRWASTSLVHALGFDPGRGSSLRLQSTAFDGPGSTLATTLREDALVRVEGAQGGRRWFTASSVRMATDTGRPHLLLRLTDAPIDGLARMALGLAAQRDPATSLLTSRGLAARLAHPASVLAGHPALAVLRAANAADTPWGSTLGRRDALIAAMAEAVRQSAGTHRCMARLSLDDLGVVLDGWRSRRQARAACQRLGQGVAARIADCTEWAGVDVELAEVLVPDGGPAWPWRLMQGSPRRPGGSKPS